MPDILSPYTLETPDFVPGMRVSVMPSPHSLFLQDYEYYDALGRDPLQERKIWGISNDTERVERLREALDEFPKQLHRRQILLKAVIRGDEPITRCLVDTGLKIQPDIDTATEDENKKTEDANDGDADEGGIPDKDDPSTAPLHTAAFRGRLEIVKLFIESGVDIDARDEFGRTPLIAASGGCHPEIMRYLLGQGADPAIRTFADGSLAKEYMGLYAGADALEISASHGNVQALRMLLEHPFHGSTRKRKNRENDEQGVRVTPLAIRGAAGAGFEALNLLLERGAYPTVDRDGKTKRELLDAAQTQALSDATQSAAQAGDLKSLMLLLSYQYPVDRHGNLLPFKVPEGLHRSFIYGAYAAMVKNQPDKFEFIHSLGLKEHESMSLDQLPSGQTINIQHLFEKAAEAGSVDCARLLIEKYGAGPDGHRVPPCMQPLYVAAANDKPELVRYLLRNHRVDVHFGSGRFATGPTALWIAIVLKSLESVALLLEHGGPVNHIDAEILNVGGPLAAILRAKYDERSSVIFETEENARPWIDSERTNFQRPNPAYVRVKLNKEDRTWVQKLEHRRSDAQLTETGDGARELNRKEAVKLRDMHEKDVRRLLAPFPTFTEREEILKNHDDLVPEWKPAFISASQDDSD